MSIVRMQVSIPQLPQGVGADAFVNTWYFRTLAGNTAAASAAEANGWLTTFYQAIDANFVSSMSGTPAVTKAYNLDDSMPRTPVYENSIALTMTGAIPLPPEVACCLSFRATYTSGVPKGRRRGRVYLGPFNTTNVDSNGRPASALRSAISTAAGALLTSSQASTTTVWQVHSQFVGESSTQNVVGGWVDDDWDIQRRRGLELTTRSTFGAGH